MMEFIRGWILGLVGTSLLAAAARALVPAGRVKKVVELLSATVVTLALLKPVIEFDFSAYSMNLSGYREALAAYQVNVDEANDRLSRSIIEEECAAYILDKAQVLGLYLSSARVAAKWGDEGCWYPYEAYMETNEGFVSTELSRLIEAELGVPMERQYWSGENEN